MERPSGVTAAALLAALSLAALAQAGPLGPLPNVTSADTAQKEGGCLVGDVVYASSEEVPGATPCERCRCARGAVRCDAVSCDPRPGCKALHRPDHCCPIYQCECEQEGRVYGNGEKLVDPLDPCRVCYCQGGEVVCRRIACFLRDDCRPRRVPGRCCPDYDNCPLRGVTIVPGTAGNSSLVPSGAAPQLDVKQEITIKEITPVSEIPVVTDVKIKEIIPLPSIEVSEYTSSKSPLFAREATTEKIISSELYFKTETPGIIEIHPPTTTLAPPETTKSDVVIVTVNSSEDASPSMIGLSTKDSISSEIYPSMTTAVASTMEPPQAPVASLSHAPATSTSKPAVVEDDDPTMLDHNPAFPPIPDDLSVIGNNHDDETMPSQVVDGDHAVEVTFETTTSHVSSTSTEAINKESPTTSTPEIIVTNKIQELTSTHSFVNTETSNNKESPMLNLRSAIPTEILNAPSSLPEDINGELDEPVETPDTEITGAEPQSKNIEYPSTSYEKTTLSAVTNAFANANEASTLIYPISTQEVNTGVTLLNIITEGGIIPGEPTISALGKMYTESSDLHTSYVHTKPGDETVSTESKLVSSSTENSQFMETSTSDKVFIVTTVNSQGPTISSSYAPKISSEITSQTELSSLPVETSDQNPQESYREKISMSTSESFVTDPPRVISTSPEIYSEFSTNADNNRRFENIETTEFVLTPFGSSESVTDSVELIKISADTEKNAAIIAEPTKKTNYLEDLNNLVGEFGSIGNQNDVTKQTATPLLTGSEEFIPVNAGYKSKNNNYNINSITEVPTKDKKQKIEIDDDETNISDALPPHDKVEPTTRLPIIDNVSHDAVGNKSAKNDIEILTQSYVPTINRKPTKVVIKKSNDKPSDVSSSIENVTALSSDELSDTTSNESAIDLKPTETIVSINLPTTTVDTRTMASDAVTASTSTSREPTTTSVTVTTPVAAQ